MLTPQQIRDVESRAYLPEHIVSYVTAVARAHPHLLEDYLYYERKDAVVFIGYPLSGEFNREVLKSHTEHLRRAYHPRPIALISPEDIYPPHTCLARRSDDYYRLDISRFTIKQKVRNMVSRAGRELEVVRGSQLSFEHEQLIREFIASRQLDPFTIKIFQNIPNYVSSSNTVAVVSAWRGERLAAFDILDTTSDSYSFYMFNFSSRQDYVPGASDLLFNEIVALSREMDKKFISMGLGIHAGVRRFKEKWGGIPFLHHAFCLVPPLTDMRPKIRSALMSIFRRQRPNLYEFLWHPRWVIDENGY